jgi:glycosyltransferase involved in cell wall biosynthesis
MRVGLLVPGFSTGPADWCIPALRNLVGRLATETEVHVFALRYPDHAARYELFGARVTALGGDNARGRGSVALWRSAAAAIAAEHRRRPFDVLHAFWAGEPGFVAALAGRALRIPTVVSLAGGELARLHDIGYGGLLRRMERLKIRLALRLAHMVTAGSGLGLASARSWLGARVEPRLRRIPLGVDVSMFAPAQSEPAAGPARLLHVASLSRVKDQATLLAAVALLRERGHVIQLDIAGSGPLLGELRSLAGRLGLETVVRWRGEISHDRLPCEYRSAQLFVLSSRHEAQSMAALEAAACGLPVVGTHVGILPELSPGAARVAPVGDASGLADGIAAFLCDESSQISAGHAARGMAESEFELARSTSRFHNLYMEAASGNGRPEAGG